MLSRPRRHSAGPATCRGRSATPPVNFAPCGAWAHSTSCAATSTRPVKSRSNASRLPQHANDEDALIEAHYLLGIIRCVRGDFVSGCSELEAASAFTVTRFGRCSDLLYGQDAKAAALGWLAMARWVLGHPDEALAKAHEGLAFVRDATQPFLLARGMAGSGFRSCLSQGAARIRQRASRRARTVRRARVRILPCSRLRVPGSQSGPARQRRGGHRADASEAWRRFARWVPSYC